MGLTRFCDRWWKLSIKKKKSLTRGSILSEVDSIGIDPSIHCQVCLAMTGASCLLWRREPPVYSSRQTGKWALHHQGVYTGASCLLWRTSIPAPVYCTYAVRQVSELPTIRMCSQESPAYCGGEVHQLLSQQTGRWALHHRCGFTGDSWLLRRRPAHVYSSRSRKTGRWGLYHQSGFRRL